MALNMKKILAKGLLDAVEEKPLAKLTIKDITDKCGCGRQTFYNHFLDKQDIIYWVFLRTLSGAKNIIENEGFYPYLCKLYREAQKYRDFLKQACKMQGQNSLSEAIHNQTYNFYKNFIVNRYGPGVMNDDLEYALQFNTVGACHLYIKWAMEGMPGPAEAQARYALQCMPAELKKYLPLDEDAFDIKDPE